ncbi:hypothetical protein ACFFJN_05890, partial [Erwinia mallotivora]|uniref:hypothetical protein n=1 Tax=Erwinia mallotivora TaxID=69222 RepID=UPI0035EF798A
FIPEFIANLPFTACHTLSSEIIVMHYTITPFGMSSKPEYITQILPEIVNLPLAHGPWKNYRR